ncbi:MAG TPA: LPS export ABC transporter periplasmic protein LptC [Burkholderiaceae bacterium]|nr:LPS export ABC transporter periplasmic protein LptC [Burkholderiaceae bacterium]
MRDRITAIIAVLLLAGLAGVTYWFSQVGRYSNLASPVSREGPDFIVNGVTLTQFDAMGRATNRLFAETMTHYAADDRAELQRPRYVSLRPDQPRLEARARQALVEGGGERVLLTGEVVITRSPGADGEPPMRLATEKLLAVPDFEQYSTDLPVEVDRGGSVIRAVGMDYDNIRRVVKFHSKVRGTVEAARNPGTKR